MRVGVGLERVDLPLRVEVLLLLGHLDLDEPVVEVAVTQQVAEGLAVVLDVGCAHEAVQDALLHFGRNLQAAREVKVGSKAGKQLSSCCSLLAGPCSLLTAYLVLDLLERLGLLERERHVDEVAYDLVDVLAHEAHLGELRRLDLDGGEAER